jgi:hypothetical protein
LILAAALIVVLFVGTRPAAGPGAANGYTAPEDAVRHFVGAVRDNDFGKAMEACALDADGFDFEGTVNRIKALLPLTMPGPSQYGFFRDCNRAAQEGTIANQIKMFAYSLLTSCRLSSDPVYDLTDQDLKDLIYSLDPANIAGLKTVSIDIPEPDIMGSEKNVENFTKTANLKGAEEMTERIALFELDGKYYLGGFQLMRYETGWKITGLNSNLAGTSAQGTVTETSLDEYAGYAG